MNKEYFSSINDVSKLLDLPAHTLRYWEKQFPTVVKPTTGAGGRRYYRPETVDALRTIKSLLHDRGMTINGVKKLIKEEGLILSDVGADIIRPTISAAVPPTGQIISAPTYPSAKSADINHAVSLLEQARAALN